MSEDKIWFFADCSAAALSLLFFSFAPEIIWSAFKSRPDFTSLVKCNCATAGAGLERSLISITSAISGTAAAAELMVNPGILLDPSFPNLETPIAEEIVIDCRSGPCLECLACALPSVASLSHAHIKGHSSSLSGLSISR